MAQMIPNMAVLPLVELLAKAQIERVQSRPREEKRDDNTWHPGSAQPPGLCPCPRELFATVRWHGTWPDSWQLAFCSRASVLYSSVRAVGYKSNALSDFITCRACRKIGIRIAL